MGIEISLLGDIRSLQFLAALVGDSIFHSPMTELYNVASADSSLNAATLVAAESVLQDAVDLRNPIAHSPLPIDLRRISSRILLGRSIFSVALQCS